jgi:hypothetical protein
MTTYGRGSANMAEVSNEMVLPLTDDALALVAAYAGRKITASQAAPPTGELTT